MKQVNSVSVLGCGWLGFPVARQLFSLGYAVKGSTTSPEKLPLLAEAGIAPFLLHFKPDSLQNEDFLRFLNSDVLLIAVPPGRTDESRKAYPQLFKLLADQMIHTPIKHLVFISSTSIYGENNEEVNEETLPQPVEASGQLMKAIENEVAGMGIPFCLLRFAGLIGPGRHPARFFSGKKDIPNGLAPVNLIHQDDAVDIILEVIQTRATGIINACAPSHPSRMEFYTLAAERAGLALPEFVPALDVWKKVNSSRLLASGFQFKYPDLIAWLSQTKG